MPEKSPIERFKKRMSATQSPAERNKEIQKKYTEGLARMTELGEEYGMSRNSVYKLLKRMGTDTSKEQRVLLTCAACGAQVPRRRGKARATHNTFCDRDCWRIWHAINYTGIISRYHNRRAREIVAGLTKIPDGGVVHHINGDPRENRIDNLVVLASSRDHVLIHKGFHVEPVWTGV